MTGNQGSVVSGQWSVSDRRAGQAKVQNPKSKIQRGFSLLELMIAMFIMIILLSLAVPTYQRSVRHAREIVLKENLFQIRKAIDQYRADKGKLPQSVDDLASEKYLREKPIDPILERAEWNEIQGEDSSSGEDEQGLVDVKSMAEGQDLEGVAYSEY
ncbi:MAG TPA: type II secretion system protein [Pyrinomonadaceae bacterium]|nr:type II secretion system protein [Pyrinomonadaceae bacterium]